MSDKENKKQELTKKEPTFQERFTNKVMALFGSNTGQEVALTNFQKRLAQNYCIELDGVLKKAEQKRLAKDEKWRDPLAYTWANINMDELANDVVSAARFGWDPAQANHINLIPFKDKASNKYLINFMPGYRGIELKAVKYGLDVPDAVIVEVVYTNDKFKAIKKDRNNKFDDYEFEIVDTFDRGEVKGGFYYHIFNGKPEKNKLVTFNKKEIEKRKPDKASPEFWGGEKDVWENGKKVGKEQVEGWYEKMVWKTLYRAAYSDITIDSQKIDDDYMRLKKLEDKAIESIVQTEVEENGNKEFIDIEADEVEAEVIEPEDNTEDNSSSQNEQMNITEENPGY